MKAMTYTLELINPYSAPISRDWWVHADTGLTIPEIEPKVGVGHHLQNVLFLGEYIDAKVTWMYPLSAKICLVSQENDP